MYSWHTGLIAMSCPSRLWVRWGSRACYQNVKKKAINSDKMVNPKKAAIASGIMDVFNRNSMVTVFHYNDLDAQEWRNLRLKFCESDIKVKVFPSKISSKVLSSTKYQNMAPLFHGCTAIAIDEEGGPSKVGTLLTKAKEEAKLVLLGGVVDQQILSPEGLKDYSKIQSKDALQQELVAILSQHQMGFTQTLQHPSCMLSALLEQVEE